MTMVIALPISDEAVKAKIIDEDKTVVSNFIL